MCSFISLNLDSNFPPQLFQNIHISSLAEVLLQRGVICGDSSEYGEVNEFFVRYVQGSYFVLKGSDCIQHVAWKLVSSLKLQVESLQVTGDVGRKASCVIQLWLGFFFGVQENANLREEAQKLFQHFSTEQPPYCASVSHHTLCRSLRLTVGTVCGLAL